MILYYLENNYKINDVRVQYKHNKIYLMLLFESVAGELEYMIYPPRELHIFFSDFS